MYIKSGDSFSRRVLTLQTLVTAPIAVFMLLYGESVSDIYTVIPIILVIFLGFNIYKSIKSGVIIKPPLLLILVITFLFYSFAHLGSRDAPQTFDSVDVSINKKGVSFDFDGVQKIDRFCYYIGVDRDVKFGLFYLKDGKWSKFYNYSKDYPFSFRWNCEKVDIETSKLSITVAKGDATIGEMRFMRGDEVIPFKSREFKRVNDESSIEVDTTYYGGMFFDEIYFARTAYEILHNLKIYETTHPFLGKALISQGIKLFGMTPYGWRFINVLFGALMIVVI